MNFAADHPKVVPLVAGLGISVAFSWTGRFLIHEALATSAMTSLPADVVSISDVPSIQVGSEIKGEIPVLDQGNFLPPAFHEGTEIKGILPPVLKDGQFMPFPEGSESKFESPVLQEGKFLPPGVIPSKEIP